MKLRIKIRKMKDGRFYIKYYWNWWEDTHKEYKTKEELLPFIEKLVKNTEW